jgi:hypothetical protein
VAERQVLRRSRQVSPQSSRSTPTASVASWRSLRTISLLACSRASRPFAVLRPYGRLRRPGPALRAPRVGIYRSDREDEGGTRGRESREQKFARLHSAAAAVAPTGDYSRRSRTVQRMACAARRQPSQGCQREARHRSACAACKNCQALVQGRTGPDVGRMLNGVASPAKPRIAIAVPLFDKIPCLTTRLASSFVDSHMAVVQLLAPEPHSHSVSPLLE